MPPAPRLVFLAALATSACNLPVSLTPLGQQVEVSDERMIQTCQYLGDVSGDSTDVDTARNSARNRAAKLGATNIVFVSQSNEVITGRSAPNTPASAMGRAYRCAPAAPPAASAPAPAPSASAKTSI